MSAETIDFAAEMVRRAFDAREKACAKALAADPFVQAYVKERFSLEIEVGPHIRSAATVHVLPLSMTQRLRLAVRLLLGCG